MKKSLKKQIAVIFIGLMGMVFFANWAMNNFFLEKYYVNKKEKVLQNVYDKVNEVTDTDDYVSEDFYTNLTDLCARYNLSFVMMDSNFNVTWTTEEGLDVKLVGYCLGVDRSENTVLDQKDNYIIQKSADYQKSIDYLEAWGQFDTGYFFLMRVPMESIQDSVRTSNEFLGYFIIIALFISMFAILWISQKITEPVLELTELSKRMADLDFNAKYTSGGQNEIGQLGQHFNQMSETLEATISELKTANNELQDDIEKKIQVDEMRKEFLSNVSHELKTPIALIQGYAEGLKECINDDAESRDFYCDVIMDEAAKMNNMVKKLLTLNQLEFGNDNLTFERFDLVKLVQGVVQSAKLLADQKSAKIIFEQKTPIYVWADEFKIEEVVTNYVSNAINHVDFDKVIEIKVKEVNEKVRLSVFNTGVPIPEEDLPKIWIKFYKVDKARTREYGGSGIGLSIVKAIMDSMHQKFGAVNYENGVEFWFELDGGVDK